MKTGTEKKAFSCRLWELRLGPSSFPTVESMP